MFSNTFFCIFSTFYLFFLVIECKNRFKAHVYMYYFSFNGYKNQIEDFVAVNFSLYGYNDASYSFLNWVGLTAVVGVVVAPILFHSVPINNKPHWIDAVIHFPRNRHFYNHQIFVVSYFPFVLLLLRLQIF